MTHPSIQQAIALSKDGRNDEAVAIIRQLASTGNPDALCILAEMTWRGGMVEQDLARGRLLYEYAASLGHAGAAPLATNLLASGIAGKRDWPAALQRLAAEAQRLPARRRAAELVRAMRLDGNGDPLDTPAPERLADRPDVRLFRSLLTPAECDYILEVAANLYEASFVYNERRERVRDPIRTSDGAAIHWLIEDPAVHAINRRMAAISGSQYEHGETLQVLRYSPGQQYHPHFDFVDGAENRRLWTALIYLNDRYEGGGTAFPHIGLEVQGKTGDVLLFGNAAPDGGPEPLAEHAGLPVTSGTKFLATRWIRESRWIP